MVVIIFEIRDSTTIARVHYFTRITLPETNSLPLKMDGWNTTFLLGRPIFRGYVSFRECRGSETMQ